MSQRNIDPMKSAKVTWLACQIFESFSREVTGLKFHILDCGCIYYQQVFADGSVDPQIGIYRDAEDGACDICMIQAVNWREMVREMVVVYNSKFQVEVNALGSRF